MKRLKIFVLIKVIFTLICLVNLNSGSLNGQDFGITNRVTKQKKINNVTRKNSTPRLVTRVVYTERYITKETTKQIKPTGLSLTVLPNSDIFLESIDSGKKVKINGKAKDESVTFEPLRAGKYKLSASLEGYEPQEADITIQREKITIIPIKLKQLTYNFSIKTNVTEGEVRFAPVTILGKENPDGTLNVKERGGFCMTPIIDGKATISEMGEGAYILDVRAKEVQYEPETVVIKIPENIPPVAANEPGIPLFPVNLENTLSTVSFNQISLSAWMLPENWEIEAKKIRADGVGVALPKDVSFRHYKDFEMKSSVRMLDGTSVGFIVRAKDEKNYYLIQLTGGDSKQEQYSVSAFIVKDGKPGDRVLSATLKHVVGDAIRDQKYFEVSIKAQGNTFHIFAQNAKGQNYPLGDAVFPDNNFPIGAVGLGVIEKSSFEIGSFTVCNEICR